MARGDAAVVACTLDIHLTIDGNTHVVPLRWTVSLVRQNGTWKWLHHHASIADDAQQEGAAYPVSSGKTD